MPVQTRRELQDRIKELESENENLQSRLDEISDIVTGNDDAEEEDEDDEDEDPDLGE
jgi:predicted RNase H-like nuclease (RuvC/YqgF family)